MAIKTLPDDPKKIEEIIEKADAKEIKEFLLDRFNFIYNNTTYNNWKSPEKYEEIVNKIRDHGNDLNKLESPLLSDKYIHKLHEMHKEIEKVGKNLDLFILTLSETLVPWEFGEELRMANGESLGITSFKKKYFRAITCLKVGGYSFSKYSKHREDYNKRKTDNGNDSFS